MATVRKRTWESDGKTREAWVVDYRDQHGKRRLKTFKRKKDADAFETEARHEVRQGTHTPDSTAKTVAEAAEEWIKGRKPHVERSTLRQYRQHVDLHINPLVGEVKLSRLTKPVANGFRDRLVSGEGALGGKRSRAMSQKVLQSFRSLISDAHGRGSVAQDVAKGVTIRASKRDKKEIAIPTQAEAKAMLETVEGRWRPLIVTAIFSGMRASELRGLAWGNVDFEDNVIHVRQRADRWDDIGPPKSEASRRDIPMPPMVVNTLKEWRLECPKFQGDKDEDNHDLVFPNGRGKVESLANIWNRCLGPLQRKCKIIGKDGKPKYGLHALRHFYASWLIDRGFAPKKVQTFMGHSSITMTLDTYAKLFESLDDDHAKLAAGELSLVGA